MPAHSTCTIVLDNKANLIQVVIAAPCAWVYNSTTVLVQYTIRGLFNKETKCDESNNETRALFSTHSCYSESLWQAEKKGASTQISPYSQQQGNNKLHPIVSCGGTYPYPCVVRVQRINDVAMLLLLGTSSQRCIYPYTL